MEGGDAFGHILALLGSGSRPSADRWFRRHRPITWPAPWYAPQTTNVQPAPCQRPPRTIVSMMFRAIRDRPLFPPSGMYR